MVSREDHLIRKDGAKYSDDDYEAHPELYTTKFAHTVAPYASIIINGISGRSTLLG